MDGRVRLLGFSLALVCGCSGVGAPVAGTSSIDDGRLRPATQLIEQFTLNELFFTDLTPGGNPDSLSMKASHSGTEIVFRLSTPRISCTGLRYHVAFDVRLGGQFGWADFSTDACPLLDELGTASLQGNPLPGEIGQSFQQTVDETSVTITIPAAMFHTGVYAVYGAISDGLTTQLVTNVVNVRLNR